MLAINIPKEVKITIGKDYICIVGPLGIIVKKSSKVQFIVKNDNLYCLSTFTNIILKQTYLSIIRGLIFGVVKGYKRKLRLIGVGFKAVVRDSNLILKIGYSHEVIYEIPKDVSVTCSKNKGIIINIFGIENVRVNQVAVEIRRLRIPDVYKGKGIHYNKEVLKLKKGKREGK